MKKTVIFLTLIFTSLSLMFTGCSTSSPSTTASSSSEKTSTAVTPGEVAYWDVLHPHIAGSHVQGLSDVVAVTSGTRQDIMFGLDYCLALKSDGTVWSWVASGSGNPVSDAKAMQVTGLSHITAISTGTGNSLALDADGHVWYWYAYGDLPSGIPTPTVTNPATSTVTPTTLTGRNTVPLMVAGLDHVTAVAAGMRFSLALLDDGTVMAWGENEWGQLGDGTTVNSDVPVKVQGLSDVVAIAAGDYHSLALKADGTVWAWGDNESGELGDGTTTSSYTPVQVKGLSRVTAIAAGEAHSLALKKDGTVWSWGNNENGQAGNGTQNGPDHPGVATPVKVNDLKNVVAIADGGISGGGPDINGGTVKYRAGYCLALEAGGSLWTWGAYGDTDEPQNNPCRKTPVAISSLSGVRFMTAGGDYAVAVVPAQGTASTTPPTSSSPTASVSTNASLSQAAAIIDKSLVMVKGSDGTEITGVVVGDGSQVATVWDFEASSNVSFQVVTPAGVSCNGTIQAFDARSAVLLLRVPGLHLPAATIGDTTAMVKGQPVTVSGVRHGVITNTDAAIAGLTTFADGQFTAQPPLMEDWGFAGQGTVVADSQGRLLGMVGVDYGTFMAHPHPTQFSNADVSADFVTDLLSRADTPSAISNGPLQIIVVSGGTYMQTNGFFKDYAAIAAAFADAESGLGAPLPASELPDNPTVDIVGATGSTTVAYPFPVDLCSSDGTVLAQGRWVTVHFSFSSGQPSLLYYGNEIGTVDGGFELTGDQQVLYQAVQAASQY